MSYHPPPVPIVQGARRQSQAFYAYIQSFQNPALAYFAGSDIVPSAADILATQDRASRSDPFTGAVYSNPVVSTPHTTPSITPTVITPTDVAQIVAPTVGTAKKAIIVIGVLALLFVTTRKNKKSKK